MNSTPTENTPISSRSKWPRRFVIAAVCLLLIAGLVATGAWFYLRSERFNRYVAEQTKAKLVEYGVRAEIGGFGVSLDAQTAKLDDIALYNQQTGQPIAKIKRAELSLDIRDLYALKFSREIAFNKLRLDGVEVFVEIDDKGRTNFEGLRNAPSTSRALTFDTTKLLTTLAGGAIHFKDRSRKIEADLTGLAVDAQPLAQNPKIIHLVAGGATGRVSYQDRDAKLDKLDLTANVSESGAEIETLSLNSSLGEATIMGNLDDWAALRYEFDADARVKLNEAARVFALNARVAEIASIASIDGLVAAKARVRGQGANYNLSGSVNADNLTAANAKLSGVQIPRIDARGKGDRIDFTIDGFRVDSVAIDDIKLAQIAIDNLKGSYDKGAAQLTAPTATVAGIELPDVKLHTLTLDNIVADVTDTGRFEITAGARLDGGQAGEVKFSGVTASALVDNEAMAIDDIKGILFGGGFSAAFNQPLRAGAPSNLKAAFADIQTKDASALFEAEGIPVAGKVRGEVDLSILGSNTRSLNGTITTHFEGKANETSDAIPLAGDVAIRVQNGVFHFEKAELSTDASKLVANGRLSQDGDSDLSISLSSSQAEQLVQLARSFEVARPFIEQYEPQIIGEFKFDGRITGNLESATIDGKVNAATVGLRDAILGAIEGRVVVSPAEARVESAVVAAQNGGTLKFDLSSPLDKKADTGKLSARIDRMSLETILAAVGSPSAEQFISGEVSGEVHLTGLPAALEGSAEISLVNGKIADQIAEQAKAELRFDGKEAFLERLEVKLPRSRLIANGSMNLEDYTFLVQGKADQIALDNMAQAFELKETKIEGSADADFELSGKAIVQGKKTDLDWESLKVELNARGKNVKVNGRDAGELSLTAQTSAGGRIEAKLVTGIPSAGESPKLETITASIELRKPGRPVVIESELAKLNVAPLLSLFAPQLASTLGGTISGRFRVEGPSTDPQGAVTLDLLRGGLTMTETDLRVANNPAKIETPATIALNGAQLKIDVTRISGPGVDLDFGGVLGLKSESPMNFTLKGVVNLDRLPPLSPDIFLFGAMTIDARADGSVQEPRLNGKIDIAGFGLSSGNQPIFISDGEGSITLSGDQLTLDRFTAKANEGTIEASGATKLEQFRPREWNYSIKANNAELIEQNYSATISGNLGLTGTPEGQLLAGTVAIPQAEYRPDIDFDNIATGGGGSLKFGSFGGGMTGGMSGLQNLNLPPINLNVRVEARDSLIIRNKQINTVGTGSLALGGKLQDPDVNGRITLDGGTLRFRGQRYEITTGALDFPTGGGTPLLNLVAEGDVSGYRVYVGLIGQIDALDTTLRSEPDLSRTEILSLVTTGRTEASTVASQDPLITGVGAAASLITTGLISKPAEQLLGLSRFQIDPIIRPNSNPAARLTLGQQLSRNFYISYSTNLATEQDRAALAEYTLSNRFSALATYSQGGSAARQSVREGVFSIELRGRQRFALGFRPEPAIAPGDPSEALDRILRPKLPSAEVTVSEVRDLKLSQKKLRELLPVMTQGFSRSLARLGERRLKEHLQEEGYFFAEVSSRCEPENCAGENLKLYYKIDPNVIYDLKEIRIEGTDILRLSAIQEYLQSQPASRIGNRALVKNLPLLGGYVRGLTSSDRLKNDEEFIRGYLADIGYRAARVNSRLAVKADSDDLIVIFDVDPGAQSEVAEVAVRGNTILPAPDLLEAVPAQAGEAFSFTRSRIGAQQIKQLYAQRGFLEIDADLEIIELAGDRVKLLYNVNEGARAVVSEIEIAGVTKTGKGWIRRYFDFKPGDILTPAKIRQTQRNLYSTNAFREVNLRADPLGGDDGAAHRVTLNLTEAKPLLFVYGLGYSTDDGVRGLMEIANTNLAGSLDSLSLRLRASSREQFSQIAFTDLRPFATKFPTTVSVFYNRNSNLIPFVRRRLVDGREEDSPDDDSFGLNRFAAFIQTERKIDERTSLRFRYNLERASLFNIQSIPETEVTRNERAIRLGMFSIGVTRDTRDSVINPTRGQLFSADHSIAMNIFGGNESFNKFFGSYQRYKTLDQLTPLLKDSTLAFSARIGLAGVFRDADRNGDLTISESEQRLPISERFFSGGATTLRGFRFETAGPQGILEPRPDKPGELPTLAPIGGDALAIFNFELRYPLTQRLRLVPFYDLGNVFRRVSDFRFSSMTNSVGLGLRINTPLGPIGVDYGFLIDPPSFFYRPENPNNNATLRQPRGAFHIRFGQTF